MSTGQTLTGVELRAVELKPKDNGQLNIEGSFALKLGNGLVVAKQSFGGSYDEFKLAASAETMDLMNKFHGSLKADINRSMGLAT